jgi:hypothetical protein
VRRRRQGRFGVAAVVGLAALAVIWLMAAAPVVAVQEGWVIRSFGASYNIQPNGDINVIEDILVDFQEPHHGIDRDIDFRFHFDDKHDREYGIAVTGVTDGAASRPYSVMTVGASKRVHIGDKDKTVTGPQRYVISYRLTGALNAQEDADEFFWNVTGAQWDVPIERASAIVTAPSITRVACFEGVEGSQGTCPTGISPSRAEYQANGPLAPGEQLTVVTGLKKGTVQVSGPILVERKSVWEQIRDFLGLKPLPLALAVLAGLGSLGAVFRLWWTRGRDRWYGDVQYLTGSTAAVERPLGAHETVVVEYAPPEIGRAKRPLRPAEVGVLMDERADTLDVSATIVDLAVRGYLRIMEPESRDYVLQKLREPDSGLLEYERRLLTSLFMKADSEGKVVLDDLKDTFAGDLADVKKKLYALTTKDDKMFAANPETTRLLYAGGAFGIMVAGGLLVFALGLVGAGILGIAVVLAGLLLLLMSPSMSRRTAGGHELFRRARGFREYMVTAETDRAKFAEETNLFEKYLPYAIVFGCTEKWAKAFEGLERQASTSGWYVSPTPFVPLAFAHDIGGFSSSVSSVMASTPSSSGSSGFGGGGFAGGGGGGGGGGAW